MNGTAPEPAPAPSTIKQVLDFGTARLAAARTDNPRFEARLLLAHVLGVEPATVFAHPERPVDTVAAARFADLSQRRAQGEPWAYLSGVREFWSLPFVVNAATLIPRPETETLIEAVLEIFPDPDAPLSVLDLGTGSGCILLAVLAERRRAWGAGVDISPAAIAVARANAEALGLGGRAAFLVGNWGRAINGTFDIVVSNPPYIPSRELRQLPATVRDHEPRVALDGGPDGLTAYREIIAGLPHLLKGAAAAFFEAGTGQDAELHAMMQTSGAMQLIESKKDLLGTPRVVVGSRNIPQSQKKPLGNQTVPV